MKNKSNMTIEVDFLAGTKIEDAVTEAKEKAALWGIAYVQFKFNDVRFSIGAGADVYEVLQEWKSHDKRSYGIVAA
jgi:hypothetical protein